jgi:hypothetical protein
MDQLSFAIFDIICLYLTNCSSSTGNKKIQGLLLNGTNSPFTIFDGISSGVNSLAVDWLTNNIYWADSLYNWIVMSPAVSDTSLFRIVVNTDLDQPMGLVVHPFRGYVESLGIWVTLWDSNEMHDPYCIWVNTLCKVVQWSRRFRGARFVF